MYEIDFRLGELKVQLSQFSKIAGSNKVSNGQLMEMLRDKKIIFRNVNVRIEVFKLATFNKIN